MKSQPQIYQKLKKYSAQQISKISTESKSENKHFGIREFSENIFGFYTDFNNDYFILLNSFSDTEIFRKDYNYGRKQYNER